MDDATDAARFQFAFTIMFHYLFPVLTMGLGVLIAVLETLQLAMGREAYGHAARFWACIVWLAGVMVGAGAVLSGYFIVATDAWMQHPVATGLFPTLLPARPGSPHPGLDIFNASSPEGSLHTALGIYLAGMLLVAVYFVNIYRIWRGRTFEYHV